MNHALMEQFWTCWQLNIFACPTHEWYLQRSWTTQTWPNLFTPVWICAQGRFMTLKLYRKLSHLATVFMGHVLTWSVMKYVASDLSLILYKIPPSEWFNFLEKINGSNYFYKIIPTHLHSDEFSWAEGQGWHASWECLQGYNPPYLCLGLWWVTTNRPDKYALW